MPLAGVTRAACTGQPGLHYGATRPAPRCASVRVTAARPRARRRATARAPTDTGSVAVAFAGFLKRAVDPGNSTTLDDRLDACQAPGGDPPVNPETGSNGCASANVQGRYTHQRADPNDGPTNSCTRASAYGADRRFLHVEQTATMIDGDCADGYCWRRAASALQQTWRCLDGTTGCAVGAAQPKYADRACQ